MKGFILGLMMVCSTASAEQLLPAGGTDEIVIPENATATCVCHSGSKTWEVEAKLDDDCNQKCKTLDLPIVSDLMGLFD